MQPPMRTYKLDNSVGILLWRLRSYALYTLAFPVLWTASMYLLWGGRLSKVGGGFTFGACLALNALAHRVASIPVLPATLMTLFSSPERGYPKLLASLGSLARRVKPEYGDAVDKVKEGLEASSQEPAQYVGACMATLESTPQWQPVSLTTPDGVQLKGWLHGFWGGSVPTSGIMCYFGGNGEYAAVSAVMQAKIWAPLGLGLFCCDYRGVGGSSPHVQATRDGLVLDCLTALSFLLAPKEVGGLGVPQHKVLVVGHSLGGGVSVEAASLCPPGVGLTVVNDRSFGRLTDAAVCLLLPFFLEPTASQQQPAPIVGGGGRRLDGGPIAAPAPPAGGDDSGSFKRWLGRTFFRGFMRYVAGWEFDAASLWPHLPPHSKVVVYSAEDGVVKFPASLAAALTLGASPLPTEQVGCLCKLDPDKSGMQAHNRHFNAQEMKRISALVAEAGTLSTGGKLLGSGERVSDERKRLPASI